MRAPSPTAAAESICSQSKPDMHRAALTLHTTDSSSKNPSRAEGEGAPTPRLHNKCDGAALLSNGDGNLCGQLLNPNPC